MERNISTKKHIFLLRSKQLEGREVLSVSSGGQHTVMIAKDKVEKETNGEGTGMEVNKGQEANGEAIQEEPGVNGGVEENMEEN